MTKIFEEWTDETPVEEAVYQSIGAASTCWEHLDQTGVFDSVRAKTIGDELTELIRKKLDAPDFPTEPYLGLATTEELFRELIARFSLHHLVEGSIDLLKNVDRALVLAEMVGGLSGPEKDYKTVDSY